MRKCLLSAFILLISVFSFISCEHKNGVSYIDEFAKPGSLEIMRQNWTRASQPADSLHDFTNLANNYIWYNPFQQVPISDI